METLLILTHLTIVLLFGIIFTLISKRLRVPHILLLLCSGIFLGSLNYNGEALIQFPVIFINSLGILALVLVVFDGASRFKLKEFDTLTSQAFKIALLYMVLNFVFLTMFTAIIFQIKNIYAALVFAALMSGTSPDAVMSIFKEKTSQIAKLLEVESLINTPITVLFPFIILSIMQKTGVGTLSIQDFSVHFLAVIQQFVMGIGTGVIMGILLLKLMKKYYSHNLSPLVLITSTLLTYILAENLNGNGVLAITIFGLILGNFYVKKKDIILEFSSIFGNSLMILVFVLVGLRMSIPLSDASFILKSILLFILYTGIRSMSIFTTTMNSNYTTREKVFLTLNFPKGVAVAVLIFTLLSYTFGTDSVLGGTAFTQLMDAELILNLSVVFMIYSLLLSTFINHFSDYFLARVEPEI